MNGEKGFLLDTNIIIYFLQGNSKAVNLMKKLYSSNKKIAVSIITVIETLSYPKISKKEEKEIKKMFENLSIIFIDWNITENTIEIARKYKLKIPDAIIGATAINNNLTLISADHTFKKIHELKFKTFHP